MAKTLSDCLKDIGEEEVTVKINGKEYTCSRTEATARKMHLMANGGYEEIEDENGEIERVTYKADYRVAKTIREFVEGRAPQEPPRPKDKGKKAGQYDSEIGRRLNERLVGSASGPRKQTKRKPRTREDLIKRIVQNRPHLPEPKGEEG